jgi:hypothetical protein
MDTGGKMSSIRSNWIAEYMSIAFVICVFILFTVILYGESLPFSDTMGVSKNEIVDSLLAVDELSGSIYYQNNYITVDANWQEGETYIGDYYSWAWMVRFASIGYLTFELPMIPDGYYLQSAHLMMYIGAMGGNSISGVYPIFNIGDNSVYPEGILEHIDYGDTFNSYDVIPSNVYGTHTFFTHETLSTPSWVSHDVRDCLLMDFSNNRSCTQYRSYLNGFSDWDNRDDYIATNTSSYAFFQYSPKIVYTLSDGTSVDDPTIPQSKLIVSCYPNPFSETNSILIKASEPGSCKLSIYNLRGQLIRSQSSYIKAAGDHTFQWDGRDETGRQISGGIYIAVVEAGRYKASSKVLYLR